MQKTTINVPPRAKAYMDAHGLTLEQLLELGTATYARDHSLGDPRQGVRASSKNGSVHVNYSPKFITRGDTNISVLSNIRVALKWVFKPTTEIDFATRGAVFWTFMVTNGVWVSYIAALGWR